MLVKVSDIMGMLLVCYLGRVRSMARVLVSFLDRVLQYFVDWLLVGFMLGLVG